LKIEKENLADHQVKLTVEVDSDQLETSKRKAAKKIAKRVKIPGFRPGKAPYQVIQRQVGDEVILEESLEILVNDIYPSIIDEAEIEPYGPGKFENIVNLDPMTLEFTVPLMAEIELGNYHDVRIPYELPEIGEDEIKAVEDDFRQRQAVEETVDRAAEQGDHVYVRLSAKRYEEDEPSEPGNLIEERATSVIIAEEGSDTSSEWPFDGFSRELIGMQSDEDKTLLHSFPEDSAFESLQDVTAEFSVHVEDVKERILPELDDDFAQSIGEYDDLEALETDIRDSLEQRSEETYNSEYHDQVLDSILETSTLKYPPQMVENEINDVVFQLERRLSNQGLDMELYLKTRDMDEQDLREEARPVAETRVMRSLVLLEIAKLEEIDVSEDELQQETERTLDSVTRFMSDSDKKQFDSPEAMVNIAGNIYAEMRMSRTMDYLRKVASGESDAEQEADGKQETEAAAEEDEEMVEDLDEVTPTQDELVEIGEQEETPMDEGVDDELSEEAKDSTEGESAEDQTSD
jgi:trigger factor